MKNTKSYFQFCPVARAAELVASRWTPVLLRELLAGSTRFSELRVGLARMSPSLLSQRLEELEGAGIIERRPARTGRGSEYFVTPIGQELSPFVMALGVWGQKYILRELGKHELDPGLLMWDVHRRIGVEHLPEQGTFVAHFHLTDAPSTRRDWWVVVRDREVELCLQLPDLQIDVQLEASVLTLTDVWRGAVAISVARQKNHLRLTGAARYLRSFERWFLLSPFIAAARSA